MQLSSELIALGFTEYEARIYLALLRDNPANGYQLSKKTGVPRSMVYEALGRLHARGAVLKAGEERATLYRPLPPDQLLERYDRQHQQLISSLQEGLNRFYTPQEEEALWSIRGQEAILSYASQMITGAEDEIYCVLGDNELQRLGLDVNAACRKGMRVGVLLTGEGHLDCDQVSYHPPAESEIQGMENMLVVVIDGEECLIANMEPEMRATVTTNRNLVLIAHQFVWMELFAQRVYERLNPELLDLLDESDRQLLLSFSVDNTQ